MMFISLMLIAQSAGPEVQTWFAMQAFHPEGNLLVTGGRKGVLYTCHLPESCAGIVEVSANSVAKKQKTGMQDSRRQVCHKPCLLQMGTKTSRCQCKLYLGVNKHIPGKVLMVKFHAGAGNGWRGKAF